MSEDTYFYKEKNSISNADIYFHIFRSLNISDGQLTVDGFKNSVSVLVFILYNSYNIKSLKVKTFGYISTMFNELNYLFIYYNSITYLSIILECTEFDFIDIFLQKFRNLKSVSLQKSIGYYEVFQRQNNETFLKIHNKLKVIEVCENLILYSKNTFLGFIVDIEILIINIGYNKFYNYSDYIGKRYSINHLFLNFVFITED